MRKILILATFLAVSSMAIAGTGLNQFSPPAGDASVDFLHEVFGKIVTMVASGTDPRGAEVDDALGQMLSIFNTAVLFLGMIFVGYTTIKGTVDSAHDGEVLGKKMSEVWVPIRTVGGTALILPLASGYSTLQIAVLWLSLQGVGIADAMWSAAISQIKENYMIANPIIPDARPLAANILRFEVCAAAMNKQYAESGRSTRIQATAVPRTMMNTGDMGNLTPLDMVAPVAIYDTVKNFAKSRYTVVDYKWRAVDGSGNADKTYINPDVCGGITWNESWESSEGNANTKIIKAPILAAHAAAVKNVILEMRPIAQQIVAGQKPAAGAIDTATEHYTTTLRAAAKLAVQETNDKARSDFLKTAESSGWIFAGTWYTHIVKMNDVMQSTLNSLPTSEPVSIIDGRETQDALQNYQDAMTVANEYAKNRVGNVRNVYYQDTNVRAPQEGEGAWEYIRKLISAPFMGAINQMTEEIAGSNLNHMSQMKSLGDTIIGTGWAMAAALTTAAGLAGSNTASLTSGWAFNFGDAIGVVSGVFTMMIIGLLGFGATLSTYAPMIPFITWMASLVNWFVLVIEAVLAAPIWAAAHIHPDGDDAVGRGGQGYMMILSVVMRPALMLFGLVTAMLLTQPVTGLVNAGFMSAVSGIQADSTTGLVSFLAYVAIYVIMMTTVLHTVFSLIHWIPDNVPRWIGGHVGGGPASPDQKEKEAGHVFAAGVSHAERGVGHRTPKDNHEQEKKARKDADNSPSNNDLLR
ncbi:MAG: DotA/TraY family protein [Propionivibrio sp.]|nr:DotA/TraY family protein [Propionivibrio sp.]